MEKENITKQKNIINDSLDWLRKYKPDLYESRFLQLVEERRKLRRLERAIAEKPAITAFGESQKGKSYLIGNLLQKDGEQFKIKSYATDNEYVFVREINPISVNNQEATGVATRFTKYADSDKRFSQKYPVMIRLFSVAEIATILCDSYYHDISPYQLYSDDEIKEFTKKIVDKYGNADSINNENSVLAEDDILDIKVYIESHVNNLQNLPKSKYFENLATIIRNVPEDSWVDVLKYLWHENKVISDLFVRLVNVLKVLKYSTVVYASVESLLHDGDNEKTIMSVDCLHSMLRADGYKMDVYIKSGNEEFEQIKEFSKGELGAVTSEVVFKIEEDYVNGVVSYSYYGSQGTTEVGDLPAETKQKLGDKEVSKDILNQSDLIDLPGARTRLSLKEGFLDKSDENGIPNITQVFLRGKVAFLFNNNNDLRSINILLYCHDADNVAVTNMYMVIEEWVNKYVGDTSEKRSETIKMCDGVSPLFYIATKFNKDMVEGSAAGLNTEAALRKRWYARFINIVYSQGLSGSNVDWFKNWIGKGESFKNSYLLRDYKFSGCTGSGNNLFKGYDESNSKSKEEQLVLNPEFYNRMRESFIQSDDVKLFFSDPALSWDVAATRNNDGALYIIDRLSTVSKRIGETRMKQFVDEFSAIKEQLSGYMSPFYISTDQGEILKRKKECAISIDRELAFACNADSYFFGHLIQSMQLTVPECFEYVHQIMPQLSAMTNNFNQYQIIMQRCAMVATPLTQCTTEAERKGSVMQAFSYRSEDEMKRDLVAHNVDCDLLFSGGGLRNTNSELIAHFVYKKWCEKFKSVELLGTVVTDSMFNKGVMLQLLDNIIAVTKFINLEQKMADSISEYVNLLHASNANENLLADLLSDIINEFILDFGYSYLTKAQKDNVEKILNNHNLNWMSSINSTNKSPFGEAQLTAIFDTMFRQPQLLVESFSEHYNRWIDYMRISFISNLSIPDYDPDANEKIGEILKRLKTL